MNPPLISTPAARQIGTKTFCDDDQRNFANVSLDCNPIHMDPIAARRLLTGRQVVHGVNLLFSALDFWQHDDGTRPCAIRCSFNSPVSIGDTVIFTQHERDKGKTVIDVIVKGLCCARILIETTPALEDREELAMPGGKVLRMDQLASPLDEPPESHPGKLYAVTTNSSDIASAFPGACRVLGPIVSASLAAASYLVGMICPGLNSVLSSLNVNVAAPASSENALVFYVASYDARFRLFNITFEGAIQGNLEAFVRQPPQDGPSIAEVATHIRPGEFAGKRSLVIGGSRGLGALTAKVLAAGGGNVVITYAAGSNEAQRVKDEINESFGGKCRLLKLDVTSDAFESMAIDREQLDAVYFFATPRIFKKAASVFDPAWFQEFVDFYIQKLYELCMYLEVKATPNKIRVYFPSSVAVQDRPKGLTEYAMAKAAAEILIEDINGSFKKVMVVSGRLPRLTTDQTASIQNVETLSNLEALLPVIRRINQ